MPVPSLPRYLAVRHVEKRYLILQYILDNKYPHRKWPVHTDPPVAHTRELGTGSGFKFGRHHAAGCRKIDLLGPRLEPQVPAVGLDLKGNMRH